FTKVGPRTGEWVGIDSSTAAITGLPPVSGGSQEVHASAPDGSGGFYIGGDFTHVGGLARHGLAHVLADRSVDPNFDPRPDGEVDALAVSGSTVYAGGFFTQIGGQPRDEIAAPNGTTRAAPRRTPGHPQGSPTLAPRRLGLDRLRRRLLPGHRRQGPQLHRRPRPDQRRGDELERQRRQQLPGPHAYSWAVRRNALCRRLLHP